MIRTFLAIRPSADVLDSLSSFRDALGDTGDVRWTKPDNLHLTIKFLGDVRESEFPEIERVLAESFEGQPPVDVEARGLGVFPNLKKPRVLWVGLQGSGLSDLVERAEIALSPLGFPPEEREFVPHLTVARFRSARRSEALAAALKEKRDESFGISRIDSVTLFRSDLRPESPVYTPIKTFPLGREERVLPTG